MSDESKFDHLINGDWVTSTAYVPNINPSDVSDVIGYYAEGDVSQVNQAVSAAKNAFPSWASTTPQQKFTILDFIGTEILNRQQELGRLLSREEGKTLPEGIGEVARAGQIFKFFAGETVRNGGDYIPSVRPNIMVDTIREPLGIVGLITPWNFPMAIPAWKIAPAIAFGNCVVFKPAELVSGSAWALAEIISRSGLPPGVFNMVMGKGAVIGPALIDNAHISGVSFTGSVPVGKNIARQCSERLAKFQLEMGGKNPLIILDDADLPIAVNAAIQGAFFSTGQRCTASSRLIVTEGIHDVFVKAMIERMQSLKIDDALAQGTDIGPVVDQKQFVIDCSYIELAAKEGAKVFGGKSPERGKKGFYLEPALFTETKNDMRINREEIFGPIASVIRVKNYEEALETANDTSFGLTSGICTTSLKYAHHFKQYAQAGMVMVNLPTAGVDFHVPFGGRKGSSYGSREQGTYAREFYTTLKTTYMMP